MTTHFHLETRNRKAKNWNYFCVFFDKRLYYLFIFKNTHTYTGKYGNAMKYGHGSDKLFFNLIQSVLRTRLLLFFVCIE